ncbi:SusD/RagB family nutrient-binding outer membrane lipoprotein [Sinomicrobium soli]|uniref:SusD/RagB family nutrient-binding outer membrane lipoprotein n=1 Tax=Sinomicrobium sp. N-1-3-6 TaxID=2219864 RepID=UPI000DCED8EE|nr:SusD/RagB family nutrient-binding outer membrane lipoprotein [Sinomicrobium sp. N-1-3-6]RAV31055.1 SusD/RagB family nutrient-binding outer membrane lipoprotein [Sinomicrobium sp. N-1-3-6]
MKKLLYIFVILFGISSCSDMNEGLNTDTKKPTDVPAETLFPTATKALFDEMVHPSVNRSAFRFFGQYWTATTYTDEPNYNLRTRGIPESHWLELYRDVLKDLKETSEIIANSEGSGEAPEVLANKSAMAEILTVYAYHVLVDSFGDVPYTEALQVLENTTPVYDDDAAVYEDLTVRLDNAISTLNPEYAGFTSADLIYGGDIESWIKLGNSLKLRMALRYADVDNAKAKSMAEEAVSGGVFTSNDDNATIQYDPGAPNTNPIWEVQVQSGRTDFVAANTIVDKMNELEDPRRPVYFKQNLGEGVYDGGSFAARGNSYDNSSQIGAIFDEPTLEGIIIEYSEVEFLLAEAIERGYAVGGTAEEHYNNAVTASVEYWTESSSEASAYLSNPDVAYSTAQGDWKEKIATQKWISLFNRPFEGWTTYRRLGYPEMQVTALSKLPTPRRYTYPVAEASRNTENYNAAVTAMGGDELSTKIFWDVE